MLNKIVPLALVAALGLGSAASALTDSGTIASVNPVSDIVTLTDGSTFVVADEDYADRLGSFKAGDGVSITYHHVGTKLEASAISPVTVTYTGDLAGDYPDHAIDHLD